MMSDHLSSNKSGRCLTGMVSPRMSEHCGPKFGVTFSNKLQNDNMSVKSTKTGILKEINQNVPRLTHLLPKKTLHRGSDPRLHGSRELKPEFHHPEDFYDNRSGRGLDFAIKKRPKSSEICFNEVADLEALVSKKDDLVILIDENETEIEKIVDRLGIKKKGIRDEQNKLLRELEDLGLKLKDFDKPTGLNLRNCTVVSPYLTRCSQQALNKLRGVTENISNKETKDEISRAIKSILSERDDRESLVLSLLSLDTATLRERLSMLQEDLEGKSSEKAEVVGRMELLAADIAKLDLAIEHDKDYHERLGELQSLKHNAARNASNTSAELGKILIEKNSIESQIKALHLEIGEKVGRKNSINSEISKFVDELADSSCKALKEWLAEIKMISFDTYQIYSDFFSDLKEMEVAKQLDFDFQDSHTVAHSRELFVGLINLTGRVISMIGQSNAESALTSFRSDYLEVHTEVKVPAQVKNVVSTVVNSLGIFLPFKFNTEQPSIQIEDFIQKLKSYLTETSKNVDRYYDLLFSKMELSERIFQLMAEVKRKETAIFEFSRQQTQIVTSIPEMKTQTKNYNYQLALLLLHNPSSESFMEEPMRDTVDEADDELMSQITKKQEEVQPHQTKDQIRESKILENRLGEERNNKLSDDIKEICDNIRRVEHEQEYVIEKVKTYRRGLIEGLNKELKEFQCIASLFDYMSKPVLSREIGVSVMDSLLHDLASVVQQISSEISRQKRIIKLVNKNEDYSHEEKIFDEMLTESIFKIKSELGQLNEKQIPELKDIENAVNEAEAINMELKDELNQVLDGIESTEQAFLDNLASAMNNGWLTADTVPSLFLHTPKLQASNYQDYILAKLAEEEEAEHNTSEIISQIDSSYMNYRHTANPKIGGQNSLSQPRISNSNSKMNHFSGRNGPKAHYEMDQVDYREEDELEDEHLDAELQHGESQRSVVLEEHTEDNEVNEAIVSAFPKKLFSKVLAVYAQTFGLFRSVVLDKLSNGIIISRKQKLSHGRI